MTKDSIGEDERSRGDAYARCRPCGAIVDMILGCERGEFMGAYSRCDMHARHTYLGKELSLMRSRCRGVASGSIED